MSRLSLENYNRYKVAQFKDKKFKETRYLELKKIEKEAEIHKMLQL